MENGATIRDTHISYFNDLRKHIYIYRWHGWPPVNLTSEIGNPQFFLSPGHLALTSRASGVESRAFDTWVEWCSGGDRWCAESSGFEKIMIDEWYRYWLIYHPWNQPLAPSKSLFEDVFSFPNVGYVSYLEGKRPTCFFMVKCVMLPAKPTRYRRKTAQFLGISTNIDIR